MQWSTLGFNREMTGEIHLKNFFLAEIVNVTISVSNCLDTIIIINEKSTLHKKIYITSEG